MAEQSSDSPKPDSNNSLFTMFPGHLLRPWCQAVCQDLGSGEEWILAPALQESPVQGGGGGALGRKAREGKATQIQCGEQSGRHTEEGSSA